ncbi:MAG: hypothetical protein WC140_07580 [Bacteroidales bacterium]
MEKEAPLPSSRESIIELLNSKSQIKSLVFDECLEIFNLLKDILGEVSNDINDSLDNIKDRRVRLEYRDKGRFEAELKFADDVLVFSMHTDVFKFDRDHPIWKNSYTKKDEFNTYCGVINVYNFLSDSMKYSRMDDLGYMVARIFINKDRQFFVEGKRQKRQKVSDFGKKQIDKEELMAIVETAILYSLSFDLLVPPFDLVKQASVAQINEKRESAKMKTGKRMGYRYNSDDVLGVDDD